VSGASSKIITLFLQIKNLPPILLKVNCTDDLIEFSPLPKVYIVTSPKKSGLFEVYDVFTQKIIGTVGKAISGYEKFYQSEEDEIFTDIRDRIVYRNNHKICVYNIDQENEKKLSFKFELKFPISDDVKEKNNTKANENNRRVQPQRKSKMDSEQLMHSYYETVIFDYLENAYNWSCCRSKWSHFTTTMFWSCF